MCCLPYPLEHEVVEGQEAETIRDILRQNLQRYANAAGPAFEVMPDLPKIDEKKLSSFRDYVQQLSAFQAEVNAVRRRPAAEQTEPAKDLVERYRNSKTPAVALELLYLVRDALTWADVMTFIEALPPEIGQLNVVREQYCLALAETGKIEEAIGALEQLIADNGSTPEREGLLGGRYKKRHGKKGDPADLDRAIEHYERGMQLDLNAYYCSSNLPRLLRTRNEEGDEERAAAVAPAVFLACERAKALGTADEWLNPTLLVSAFDAGDVSAIATLTRKVRAEGHASWKLKTAIADAKTAIKLHADAQLKEQLQTALVKLEALLPPEA
jgi:tetratricopeptide (TPR) repeat protein